MSFSDRDVLIVGAARTPIGSFKGQLASLSAVELGGLALAEAIRRSTIPTSDIAEVFMGNVISAGNGQNPARQAALKAGLPNTCVCSTVNKVCASGMKAIMLAAQQIQLGQAEVVAAGGMESMSNTPFLMKRAEPAYGGFSHSDSLVLDGLTDAASGRQMGELAEQVATDLAITREAQDNFAIQSYQRSAAAWDAEKGAPLAKEVFPVTVTVGRGQQQTVTQDEEFGKVNFEKLRTLRTVFKKENGTITAGNASTLSDGAAAVVLVSGAEAKRRNLKPIARIVSYADAAGNPKDFPIIPALAMPKVLEKAGLKVTDVSLFEINEAFSLAALGNIQLCKIDSSKVNVNGGAVSLGHPLGMSGTRIVNSLALQLKPGQYGLAGICNGGGGASAVLVQAL